MNFEVLLFYQYCHIADPTLVSLWQQSLAKRLGLLGRILIADEGINGTLSGTHEACKQYIQETKQYTPFCQMNFKKSRSSFIPFESIHVKIKNEIVVLREDKNKIPFSNSAEKLCPQSFHNFLEKKYSNRENNIIIFDTRNAYESRIGRFSQAICPQIQNSRQFRQYFQENSTIFDNKVVLMYCTGGVRCERISALLADCTKPQKIYHLENGIHAYCEEFSDGYFHGRNYVFDDRVSVKITDDILTQCDICKAPCDLYNNCLNAICNKQYIACDRCLKEWNSCCSQKCVNLTKINAVPKRPHIKSRSLHTENMQ